MVLVRFTGRMLINLSSLSTEGAVGNYNPLQRASVIFRKNPSSKELDVSDVPVITGNMLKHWHAIAIRDLEVAGTSKPALCEDCLRGVMMRTRLPLASEHRYIQKCVIDDLHGFLLARGEQEVTSEGETQEKDAERVERRGLAIRRESLVKIGNALPVEEHVRRGVSIDSLVHNRIVLKETGEVDKNYMMPFRREYTSSYFAFYAAADLTYVGVPMSDPYADDGSLKIVIDNNERLRRIGLALDVFMVYFSDVRGAGSSRSLPHTELLEAVALITSKKASSLISAFYEDYVEQTFTSLPLDDVTIVIYNIDEKIEKLKEKYKNNVEGLKVWERIYRTETVKDFFRVIKEKSFELARQEKVKEIGEEDIKKLETEVQKTRSGKKKKS
ncbi:MAG: DevR family CRISPR-associated autoregulator [Candidatus Brockarchaeota archaeon]|nr:DevR family CRISPR-associated autoregulator [Candidatus Brockarchaeota archaeon]